MSYQASSHSGGASSSGNSSDWISHCKLPIDLQRGNWQVATKSPKGSDFNPLPNNEVPHDSRNLHIQGRQRDSRECYNKSLELAEKRERLPQVLEEEKTNNGPMEKNIDPCLQEEESTAGLIDIQVDPSEPSQLIRIGKELKSKLTQ